MPEGVQTTKNGKVQAGSLRGVIVGLGGGGCNVVSHIGRWWPDCPPRVAMHTDAQKLRGCTDCEQLLAGVSVLHGLGTSGDAARGRRAIEQEQKSINAMLEDVDLLFLAVGLGGGTGTGGAPLIAKQARSAGVLTVCFATLPFIFEGPRRMHQANEGLKMLQKSADAVVVFPNECLLDLVGAETRLTEAFTAVDEIVAKGIRAIWSMLTQTGIMNVDFADLRGLMQGGGRRCSMAHAEGSGPDKARQAVRGILESDLLQSGQRIAQADHMLVSILGGENITLAEVNEIMTSLTSMLREEADVLMGTAVDSTMQDQLVVTVLVAEGDEKSAPGKTQEQPEPEKAPTVEVKKSASSKSRSRVKKGGKKGSKQALQTNLDLESPGRGRFKDVEPTIYEGEDLDTPTFTRRNIKLSKS
jgi:cell division protein FtsZ